MYAAQNGCTNVVETLVKHGASVDIFLSSVTLNM